MTWQPIEPRPIPEAFKHLWDDMQKTTVTKPPEPQADYFGFPGALMLPPEWFIQED